MNMADRIEDNYDSFAIHYDGFIMSGEFHELSDEEREGVVKFVNFIRKEYEEELDAPRHPDGLSFRQRRDNEINNQSSNV